MNRPPGRYKPDNGGLYRINVNGKYGFMDRSGKTVITPQFDAASGFSEGLASVKIGTKWGYINTKGVVAITPQFDVALSFRYGRATVMLGDRMGFIDKDGKYISSPNFRWAGEFSGDMAPVMTVENMFAFVRRSGQIVLSGKFGTTSEFSEGLAPAASGGRWGYIDTTGKWVIDPQFESAYSFADGLAPVKVGGRWGYVDQKGKFIVNPQYDSGGVFQDGYARFGSGGRFGFIDTKGSVVIDAKFLDTGAFSGGLAPVKTEDGWGFIDETGNMVVSPQFDTADAFQNGLARVTALGKEAYVTTAGTFVVDPFPGTNVRAEKARLAAEAAQAAKANAAKRLVNPKDGLTYVWIPPGTFQMGCSPGDSECNDDEKPAHQVTISGGFWMGQTEVTQEAWQRVMGTNPSHFKGAKLPVENISWNDARSYCQAAGMRLPTEAEWEYAARAGSSGSRYGDLDAIAWYVGKSGSETHEVGGKQANPWGLYDMLGNVFEWVADWYAQYPPGSATDPQGPASGTYRALRGGAWSAVPQTAGASFRGRGHTASLVDNVGVRCAGN